MTDGREQISRYGMRAEQLSALRAYRVRKILLVASRYDSFLLEEEGQLAELLAREYRNLELHIRDVPRFVTAESGRQALDLAASEKFELVVTTTRLADMSLARFGEQLKAAHPELALGVLVPHAWDIPHLAGLRESGVADFVFLWQGDVKTLLAMIEQLEDRRNAPRDVLEGGVRALIVVEDDFRFLSMFLPHLYSEVTQQTSRLMAEGLNLSHRLLRLRARPKILLARTFDEAWDLWRRYAENVLAVIADVGFPRSAAPEPRAAGLDPQAAGADSRAAGLDPRAGLDLADRIHAEEPDLPVLLQSSDPSFADAAHASGCRFALKEASTLVGELRSFLLESCGFGDFVFRLADGRELGRAANLRELLAHLAQIAEGSIEYHASHNHFSRWFAARTEFALAAMVRPRRVQDFASVAELRAYLVETLAGYLREIQRSVVADFLPERFDEFAAFARIGSGPLGGKGRGLAFVQRLLAQDHSQVEGCEMTVPQTVILAADVFEEYLEANDLRWVAPRASGMTDGAILDAFRRGRFGRSLRAQLAAYLQVVRDPIAVRSSSVLEDSPYQSFAGVYATIMLPNNHPSLDVRLAQLLEAIKVVYSSTYMKMARSFLETTPHGVEEERMAVLLQHLVGSRHGDAFYPLFSGVAASYNFYPFSHVTPDDGVALVAVGLGKAVVEGFEALRFSPAHPQVLPQFSSVEDVLRNAQRRFWALDMTTMDTIPGLRFDANLVALDATEAMRRPDAALVASTYRRDNDSLVDGLARDGVPLVTFARLLRGRGFPLPQVLQRLLAMTQAGMGIPVEVEFAADAGSGDGEPAFHVLQVRPMVVDRAASGAAIDDVPAERVLVASASALGNGRTDGLFDVIVVWHDLDRARTAEAAIALERLNGELRQAGRRYLLIGPGRWGSRDPWLGVPVAWPQISAAAAIVEVDFDDLEVEPSQGSHFFHNLTCFAIPFLAVHRRPEAGAVRWDWLAAQPVRAQDVGGKVRHLRLDVPLRVLLDGARRRGVVVVEDGSAAARGGG